jgi:hypothetical protein
MLQGSKRGIASYIILVIFLLTPIKYTGTFLSGKLQNIISCINILQS